MKNDNEVLGLKNMTTKSILLGLFLIKAIWALPEVSVTVNEYFPANITALENPTLGTGFTEEHDDGLLTEWTVVGDRSWAEVNGKVSAANQSTSGFLIRNDNILKDGVFEVEMTPDQWSGSDAGVVFRYTSETAFYALTFHRGGAETGWIKLHNSSLSLNVLGQVNNLTLNATFTVKINVVGNQFDVYIDNQLLKSFTDDTHASGKVGYAHNIAWGASVSFEGMSWNNYVASNALTGSFNIFLSEPSTTPLEIEYKVSDAVLNELESNTIALAAGETNKKIDFNIVGCLQIVNTETYQVSQDKACILANVPVYSLSASVTTLSEPIDESNSSSLDFVLHRSISSSAQSVSFTVTGSSENGIDFEIHDATGSEITSPLAFAVGETSKTISLVAKSDEITETSESIIFTIDASNVDCSITCSQTYYTLENSSLLFTLNNTEQEALPLLYEDWSQSVPVYYNTSSTGANIVQNIENGLLRLHLTQTNFPFSLSQEDGIDLRFSNRQNEEIPFYIESWDDANQVAIVWVKVNLSGNTQDYFNMFWGNANTISASNSSIWSPDYSFYWSLDKVFDLSVADETSNDVKAEKVSAAVPLTVNGISGKGMLLNGTSAVLTSVSTVSLSNAGAVSFWVNRNTTGAGVLFSYGETLSLELLANGALHFSIGSSSLTTSAVLADASWHHITLSFDFTNGMKIYVDGLLVTESVSSTVWIKPSSSEFRFGAISSVGLLSKYFNGAIDEISLQSSLPSAEDVMLAFLNHSTSSSLLEFDGHAGGLRIPSQFKAISNSGSVTLSWIDNSLGETGFKVYSGESQESMALLGTVTAPGYIHESAGCGKSLFYEVKAVNANYESLPATLSSFVKTSPCAPTSLSALALSATSVSLQWNGLDEFVLQAKIDASKCGANIACGWNDIYTGTQASYTHSNLLCQTPWEYRVYSRNVAGVSNYSTVKAVTTGFCTLDAPSLLVADNSVADQITLAWQDNSDLETHFKAYRKLSTEVDFVEVSASIPANAHHWIDNTVACGQSYDYFLQASNSILTSSASNTITIKSAFCGAAKNTEEMITVSGMALAEDGTPLQGSFAVTLKLYDHFSAKNGITYQEEYEALEFKNGYYRLVAGLQGDIASVISQNPTLYYEVLVNGVATQSKLQLLTASPYVVKSKYRMAGAGSPIELEVEAAIGTLWIDTENGILYFKKGIAVTDWIKGVE